MEQSEKIHPLSAEVAALVEHKPGASVWQKPTQQIQIQSQEM